MVEINVHLKVLASEPEYQLRRLEYELAERAARLTGTAPPKAPPPPMAAVAAAKAGPPAQQQQRQQQQEPKPGKGPKGKRKVRADAGGVEEEVPMPTDEQLTCRGCLDPEPSDVPEVTRVKDEARRLAMTSSLFRWVDPQYYSRDLAFRVQQLDAPGPEYLCKSIVVQNTQCTRDDCAERLNSKYYLLCFQYVTKFDASMMMKLMRDLNPGIGKRKFNFRLAEDLEETAGFPKNATAPVALRTEMPVILSSQAAELPFMWLGGGHVDVKLRIDTAQFRAVLKPLVLNVCEPLTADEIGAIGKGG